METEGYTSRRPRPRVRADPVPREHVGARVAQPVERRLRVRAGPDLRQRNGSSSHGTGIKAGGDASPSGLAWVVLRRSRTSSTR